MADDFWARYAGQTGFIRWVTRGAVFRYALRYESGAVVWELVEVRKGRVHRSQGAFYDRMDPCAPTWRTHHPDARVEAALAVRKRCAQIRQWVRESHV